MNRLAFYFFLLFPYISSAQLSFQYSFTPFIYEHNYLHNVSIAATSTHLAYYNYSTSNYKEPSALIYRIENGSPILEANLFHMLPTAGCSLSKFSLVENQALLVCQHDRSLKIHIFVYSQQSWNLEKSIDHRGSIYYFENSRPNQFLARGSEGFLLIEKRGAAPDWQIHRIKLPFNEKTHRAEQLVWVNDTQAIVSVHPFAPKSPVEFHLVTEPLDLNQIWATKILRFPKNIRFSTTVDNLKFQNGFLLVSDVTGSNPNPVYFRFEIFKLDLEDQLQHLQSLQLNGETPGYSSTRVVFNREHIYVSRHNNSQAGAPNLSGQIDVFHYNLNKNIFEHTETLLPDLYSQPGLNLGFSIAANDHYLFATTANQPSVIHGGQKAVHINVYKR